MRKPLNKGGKSFDPVSGRDVYRVLLKGGKGDLVRYDFNATVIVLKCCGRSEIAGSYESSTFNVLRKLDLVC